MVAPDSFCGRPCLPITPITFSTHVHHEFDSYIWCQLLDPQLVEASVRYGATYSNVSWMAQIRLILNGTCQQWEKYCADRSIMEHGFHRHFLVRAKWAFRAEVTAGDDDGASFDRDHAYSLNGA